MKMQLYNLVENHEEVNASDDYRVSKSMVDQFLKVRGKSRDVAQIKPIVENSDTLAFYVEFLHGWELF